MQIQAIYHLQYHTDEEYWLCMGEISDRVLQKKASCDYADCYDYAIVCVADHLLPEM